MKVFISSLIRGFQAEREAVRRVITSFRHQAIMAEDFGAKPHSPQIACLTGVRESDLVLLLLGASYGDKQASGLSATHEEVREALGRKTLLLFLQTGVELEPEQQELLKELDGWEHGLYRAHFATIDELRDRVTQALSDFDRANTVGAPDPDRMLERALAMFPEARRHQSSGNGLEVALALGPEQSVLRPSQMDPRTLGDAIKQHAMFGEHRILSSEQGAKATMQQDALVITQERQGWPDPFVTLWPSGDLLLRLPIPEAQGGMGSMVLLEEEVKGQLAAALGFSDWLLSHIDPTHRLTHAVLAVRITGSNSATWRTRAEHQQSPNSISMGMRYCEVVPPVTLRPAHQQRAALRVQVTAIVEDLSVLLRRQFSADTY